MICEVTSLQLHNPNGLLRMMLKLQKKGVVRSVATLLAGSGSAQLLALLVSPLITRLYTPAEFGSLGVFVAIITMSLPLTTMGYDLAIPIADDDVSGMNLLLIAGFFTILVTCVACAILGGWGGSVAQMLNVQALGKGLWLLPVSLFGAGLVKALTAWAIRRKDYPQISKSKITQALGQVGIQLGLGFLHWGAFGLLIADVVGRGGGAGNFLRSLFKRDLFILRSSPKKHHLAMMLRYKKFAYISVPSAIFHTAGTVLPTILLASLYGTSVAGWYVFCQRIIWGPLSLVGISIAQVFLGEAASRARAGPIKLKQMMIKTSKTLILMSSVPLIFVMIFGGKVFPWLFGPAWANAGIYAQILSLTYIVQFFVGPVFQVLYILERQAWLLTCDVIGVVLVVASIYLSHANGLSSIAAVSFYSVSVIIMYGALLFSAFKAVNVQIDSDIQILE
jgi:O-antigen/teichoic acid export membrane protein